MRRKRAFTLVELLVVIGIIAVLISILLPALSGVRKQANATKCMTALREIGSAMAMYSMENRGFYPATQVQMAGGQVYNVDGVNYPLGGVGAYWFNFLAKYVTKNKMGTSSNSAHEAADARKTILWGCPEWAGYFTGTVGELNRVQVGLGMNAYPTFKENYPAPNTFPPTNERNFIQSWTANNPNQQIGNWQKQSTYGRNGARRCLVADSQYWLVEASPPPANGPLPGQKIYDPGPVTYSLSGQTMMDVYRHGKFPKVRVPGSSGYYHTDGGKVAFNILWCDGHVTTEHDRKVAYRSLRMKFPG